MVDLPPIIIKKRKIESLLSEFVITLKLYLVLNFIISNNSSNYIYFLSDFSKTSL